MREIKFRAWDKALKRMTYSSLYAITFDGRIFYGNADVTDYPQEVMQYTGLKDQNGKEIYEGDIVRTELGYAQIIVWSDMYAAFVAEYPNGDRPYRVDCTDEVIGNIHENPELLEGKP